MNSTPPNDPSTAGAASGVGRQIVLPMSKAVEIAYKSIRLRLSRSLLVTSGIVLALAFLMSILASDAMIASMRQWAGTVVESPRHGELRAQRDAIEENMPALRRKVEEAAALPAARSADVEAADAALASAVDFDTAALKQRLGGLPLADEEFTRAYAASPDAVRAWIDQALRLAEIRGELTAPQRLENLMQSQGVPTSAEEIASNAIQTRWLVGLALLVAFVGILNAMLMSVTERFREIGTMKCLGALDSFIIKLFLIESLFQGVVGTVIGVIVGLILSVLAGATSYGSFAFVAFPAGQIALSVVVCLAVGVGLTVAGAVYPAWQAARMQPIEAMRADV